MAQQTEKPSKKPTRLQELKTEWEQNPQVPTETQAKKLVKAYQTAVQQKTELESQLAGAAKAEEEAVIELVRAFGVRSFEIDGVVLEPWCRGDRVFLRKRETEVVRLTNGSSKKRK